MSDVKRDGIPDGFISRAMVARPSTLREDDRSVEFVISTEEPARVFDWQRLDVVDEVLLMDGMVLPRNKQVPFLDSHARESVEDVLGSMREIRIEGGVALGRAYFSRKQRAYDAYQDVRDQHITDVSVGYVVTDAEWVPEGARKNIQGREYVGPLKVSKKWELREVSLTPIGADPNAKARSKVETPIETVVNDGQTSGIENFQEESIVENKNEGTPVTQVPPVPVVDLDAVRAEATERERVRIVEIRTACKHANLECVADEMIARGITSDEARKEIIEKLGKAAHPVAAPRVEAGLSDGEKFRAAAVDGIALRSGVVLNAPAAGAQDFRRMSLLRIAEETLRKSGVNTRGMSSMEIAGLAMGIGTRGAYAIAGSTADFANILYDAANKTIQKAYEEAPREWSKFCRKASAADFKALYRPQLSESPDLALINENGEYSEAKFAERSENYSVATYGKRFTISRKAIVNDDLDAFSRIPRAFGAAAQRKIESLVFGILTANGNMSDSVALFHATHSNLVSGEAFSNAAVQNLMKAMMIQKGFSDDAAPLMIMPKYLIVPVALKFAAMIAVSSTTLPTVQYPSGTLNPVREEGIQVVASPFLDANSSIAFYMAADQNFTDTIEVGFLEGNESPVLEQVDQTDVDGRVYHVRIDVGAKALDWRGLAKHAGA